MSLPKEMIAGLLAQSEWQDQIRKIEDDAKDIFSTQSLLDEIQAYTDANPGLFPFAIEITNRCLKACNNNINKFFEVLKLTTPEIAELLVRYVKTYIDCSLYMSTEIARAERRKVNEEVEAIKQSTRTEEK